MDNRALMTPHIFSAPMIFFGKESSSSLRYMDREETLLLASGSVSGTIHYKKLAGFIGSCSEKSVKNPDISNISSTSREFGDVSRIVAVGGGSVLDAAKIIRHFIETDSNDPSKIGQIPGKKKVTLIAVPTTPGTGSHTTSVAVIRHDDNIKIPYVNTRLMPDAAVLDTNFLLSLSKEYMAYSAADILSHNMEGCVSRLSNNFIKHISATSMEMLKEGFLKYEGDPEETSALEKIFMSGHLAGLVQGNSFVGVCHAIAHSLETLMQINHGCAILSILEGCTEWLKTNDKNNSYGKFLEFYNELGLERYKKPGLLKSVDTDRLAELALADPSIRTSPVKISPELIRDLIRCLKQ